MNYERQIDDSGVLCYVDDHRAYFTTQALADQWGDDWNDAPYEHNAGRPYQPCWHNEPKHRNDPAAKRGLRPGTQEPLAVGEMCRCKSCLRDWNEDGTLKWHVFYVFYDGPFETPADRATSGNSAWSVEQINGGQIAWLLSSWGWPNGVREFGIPAGTTYEKFRELVSQAGGAVYEPRKEPTP